MQVLFILRMVSEHLCLALTQIKLSLCKPGFMANSFPPLDKLHADGMLF
jgi:hypothetical protein